MTLFRRLAATASANERRALPSPADDDAGWDVFGKRFDCVEQKIEPVRDADRAQVEEHALVLSDSEARPRAAALFRIGLSGLHDPREHADLPGAVGSDERLESGRRHDHHTRAPRDRVGETL